MPAPAAEDSALETYRPERGEVFYEEEPKPFAVSLREILEEYRSDSSPSRYAMAVELGEADDWEEYLGPQLEEPEPIYPQDGRAVQDMLQASWHESHADEPDVTPYPPVRDHHRRVERAPYEEPKSTEPGRGYRAGSSESWKDIVEEYRSDRPSGDEDVRAAAPAAKVGTPMTPMEEQSDTRAAVPDSVEDALPAGIRTLQLNVADGKVRSVRVDMGAPAFEAESIPVTADTPEVVNADWEAAGRCWKATCVSMGNPHLVVLCEDPRKLDLEKIGPVMEKDLRFPEGVNTEFVSIESDNEVRMRVWERGSGETLACGTGACAVTAAMVRSGLTDRRITVHLTGGDLEIEWNHENNCIYMTGPAVTVFEGEIEIP